MAKKKTLKEQRRTSPKVRKREAAFFERIGDWTAENVSITTETRRPSRDVHG